MIRKLALARRLSSVAADCAADNYPQQVEHWRAEHQKKLAADYGWLTVVGLDWLKEGDNRVGADPSSQVPLAARLGAAARCCHLFARGQGGAASRARRPTHAQRQARHRNHAARRRRYSRHQSLEVLFDPARRSGRNPPQGQRQRERANISRDFRGIPSIPPGAFKRSLRPGPLPHSLVFHNTIGQEETEPSPGYVTFQKDGREFRLEADARRGQAVFRSARSDQREDDLRRISFSLCGAGPEWNGLAGFQPGRKSALRVHGVSRRVRCLRRRIGWHSRSRRAKRNTPEAITS